MISHDRGSSGAQPSSVRTEFVLAPCLIFVCICTRPRPWLQYTMSVMPQPPPGNRQSSANYPAPNEYDQGNPPQPRNSTRSSTRGPGREGSVRSGSGPAPAVQTAVTRLLVATKHLLESLTNWSKGEVSENGVSDVYVRMGNDFNSAVAAFQACGIDMS
ncbi:Bud site selection protein 6 [Ceratobasidium sp. 428]|nr:Bud site selection protein 6 [Ceratobasidium sp. 428]